MKKVIVVMGGLSSEREISILSGTSVVEALTKAGYEAIPYRLNEDLADFIVFLKAERPDVVFNALHGKYGEDGCVQGVLNMMGIPYTHSGVTASAVGMDKNMTLQVVRDETDAPKGRLMSRDEFLAGEPEKPYVIKPNREGSSVGVFIVHDDAEKEAVLKEWADGKKMMVEEYIPGRELSATVLDGKGVGVVEIVPKTGYYDFQNKYTEGGASHLIPAPVPPAIYKEALRQAEAVHRILGCRGVSRCDFRYDDKKGRLCLLEINTNPGMTGLSLVPETVLKCLGMSYERLVAHLAEEAECDA